MTSYPVRRSWRLFLRFAAGVLLLLALSLAMYALAFSAQALDRRQVVGSMVGLALAALLLGGAAYGWQRQVHIPWLRSSVLAGYIGGGLFAGLGVGLLASALPLSAGERMLFFLLLFFATGLGLALGALQAGMLSARLQALIGAADALRLGHYHARVEISGTGELARLGEALNSLAERMEAAERKDRHLNRLMRDLQGWVGMDLRVPLSKALATVDAVAAGTVDNPETYLRFLRSAQLNIHLLSDLADDLSDMTQADVGGPSLQLGPADAEQLVNSVVASLARAAHDRGIVLAGAAAPGLPAIEADALQVERVLVNLVTHALHRTPAGGVVKVNAYPLRHGVLFEVVDYFEGERPEEMERLLQLFLDEGDVRRRRDSVPLGIAMAQTILQAHGSTVRSERLGGSKGVRLVFALGQPETGVERREREM